MREVINADQLRYMLTASVEEVLETMFFTPVLGATDSFECADEPMLYIKLDFHGYSAGWLSMSLTWAAARVLAENFLGLDESEAPSDSDIESVACESLNMIGGAVLRRLASDEIFQLNPPQLISVPHTAANDNGVECILELEHGVMAVTLFAGDMP